jgi:hypothetical protein
MRRRARRCSPPFDGSVVHSQSALSISRESVHRQHADAMKLPFLDGALDLICGLDELVITWKPQGARHHHPPQSLRLRADREISIYQYKRATLEHKA